MRIIQRKQRKRRQEDESVWAGAVHFHVESTPQGELESPASVCCPDSATASEAKAMLEHEDRALFLELGKPVRKHETTYVRLDFETCQRWQKEFAGGER